MEMKKLLESLDSSEKFFANQGISKTADPLVQPTAFQKMLVESERSIAKRNLDHQQRKSQQVNEIAQRVADKFSVPVKEKVTLDKIDTVTMDIPLLIRLLEFAREEIQDDAQLHEVSTNLIELSKHYPQLTMKQYSHIIGAT
jgi:hypothetical protein